MTRRSLLVPLLALVVALGLVSTGARPVAAADYTLETAATYDVRPDDGEIGVAVTMTFTNTTPNPAGRFSVFPEIKLAVHDDVTEVTASDAEGDLDVAVAVEEDVNVATIELREDLRYEQSVEVEMAYTLADGEDPQLRVRPSVVVFPAWGFGTSSEVTVSIPTGYDVRTDGDELQESDGELVSGPIEDPSAWVSLVTATRPAEYTTVESTVPLEGGTADLQVRAFADDEAWGERTLDLAERALPLLEEEIGLPYPHVGGLVLTESVASDSSGFAEAPTQGTEIQVAFDQPPFTVLHQVAHVWLSPTLIESRWIREGLASDVAARIAGDLEVEPPYDPAAEATERAEAAFPLDTWEPSAEPDAEGYGHAASWALVADLSEELGPDVMRTVLARVAGSIGPYSDTEIDAEPANAAEAPQAPLTTRGFLDQLETVSGADLAEQFSATVLTPGDVELLPARTEARDAFDELVERSEGWGAPDPIRSAMSEWRFQEAQAAVDETLAWLDARDELLVEMEAVGLSAPDRLRLAYRSFGGGPEAQSELDAQGAVVDAYEATAAEVNAPRSFVERVGLIGGPDAAQQLAMANGRFADGDLRGAVEAITEAQRIIASAEAGGIVRIVSAVLVVVILAALAVVLFRRRAAYTPPR